MSDEPVGVDDVVGIWARPDHERVPCVCCGICACDSDGGQEHSDQRWCYICIGRGHHEDP